MDGKAMSYNSSETRADNFVALTTLGYRDIVSVRTPVPVTGLPSTTLASCYQGDFPICELVLQATYYFTLYGTYLSYVIGIPGSFLTCVILTRMRPFTSSLVWFTAINVTGLFNLSLRFGYSLLLSITHMEDWSCKFLYLMAPISEFSTHLFLVGLTVERFIAVWFPLKIAVWCSIRRTVCAIVIITTICVGQSLYVIEVYRLNGVGVCVLRAKYKDFWEGIFENIVYITEFILVPILVIIVFNILIANRMKRAKLLQQLNLTDSQSTEKRRQQSQINRMLMAASISSVIFLAPIVLFSYSHYPLLSSNMDGYTLSLALTIMDNISNVLKVYKYAANFIVYSWAARRFRMELVRMLTCGRCLRGATRSSLRTNQ